MEDVVGHPALVITRNVEWGTVIFGFEQANKYTIYDQEGNVVALLAEELGSFGKEVGRQLLRTRRPFTATVFSPDGMIDHHQARLVHACFKTCRLDHFNGLPAASPTSMTVMSCIASVPSKCMQLMPKCTLPLPWAQNLVSF